MSRACRFLGAGLMIFVTAAVVFDWVLPSQWATPIGWWGYILLLDGWLSHRTGASPFLGRPARLLGWCSASLAFWLLFEAYNLHLRNWQYIVVPWSEGLRFFGYVVAFSTVLPGVFLTTELLGRLRWFARADAVGPRFRIPVPDVVLRLLPAFGAACLTVPLVLPAPLARWSFGLVWLGFFLFLDPWNAVQGRPSLLEDWGRGLWGRTLRLLTAGLVCGLLWESWNWGAATKWVYRVPVLPRLTLFEMPVAGFAGFPAFALELFAMWHAVSGAVAAVHGDLRRPCEPRFEAF